MEKNSDTKDSNSEGSLDDNTENPELEMLIELEKSLFLKQKNLVKHVEDLKETMDRNRKTIAYFEELVSSKKIIEHQSTNLKYLECLVSPIGSPTHNSENSSEDSIENSPDSIVSTSRLMLPDSTSHSKKTFGPSEILPPETNQDSTKESNNTLKIVNPEILKEMLELQIEKLQSNISDKNETGVDIESDSSFEIILHRDSMESNADSSGNSVGKGKEAANPKFRYKKRSKADVSSNESIDQETSFDHSKEVFDSPEIKTPKPKSPKNELIKISPILCRLLMQPKEHKGKCDTSCESLDKDTPVKHSKKEFGSPDSKTLQPQSPKEEFTRVSPSVKRKQSDSNEQDDDKIQSDESCAKTSPFTNLSGNHEDDDNLKNVKKLKFEDEEKPSKQYASTTSLLLQKKHEELNMDLAEFIGASQTDQSGNSSEQLILPSTSGLSNKVSYIFTSEESSPTDESDILSNENGLSSLFYVSEDVSSSESRESFSKDVRSSEIGESSLANVSEDVKSSEIRESPLANVSEDVKSSEIGELSLANVSEDMPSSEIGESSLASVIEDVPSSEIGEPSRTSVSEDVALSEIEESYHITVDKDISLSKEPTFEDKREDK